MFEKDAVKETGEKETKLCTRRRDVHDDKPRFVKQPSQHQLSIIPRSLTPTIRCQKMCSATERSLPLTCICIGPVAAGRSYLSIFLTFHDILCFDSARAKSDLVKEIVPYGVMSRQLEEFISNYSAPEALRWYTRDSFLYRSLNRAGRTGNLKSLLAFRMVIIDLEKQLGVLYNQQHSMRREPFTVYRGQGMLAQELQTFLENIGSLFSIDTFLSTTPYSSLAVEFAGNSAERLPHERSVLFEIDVDFHSVSYTRPFADVSAYSHIQSENEILFAPKTLFRIVEVDQSSYGGLCLIKLSLADPYDHNLDKLLYFYKAKLGMLSVYEILDDTGRTALAWDMAYTHLTALAGLDPAKNNGMIYFECAQLWESSGCFDLAVTYYRYSLKILRKVGTVPGYFGHICRNLAICYHKQGMHLKALAAIQRCWKPNVRYRARFDIKDKLATLISILEKFGHQFDSGIFCVLNLGSAKGQTLIGNAHATTKNFERALDFYEKAIDLQKTWAVELTAPTHFAIANLYTLQGEHAKAIRYYRCTFDILSNSKMRLLNAGDRLLNAYHCLEIVYSAGVLSQLRITEFIFLRMKYLLDGIERFYNSTNCSRRKRKNNFSPQLYKCNRWGFSFTGVMTNKNVSNY